MFVYWVSMNIELISLFSHCENNNFEWKLQGKYTLHNMYKYKYIILIEYFNDSLNVIKIIYMYELTQNIMKKNRDLMIA